MTSKLDTAGLMERFLIWANEIDIDGTPSQVGPTSDDLRQWAEALTQAAAVDMELQRFTPKTTTAGRDALPIFMGMEPDPDGAWVHYTEARAAQGEGR